MAELLALISSIVQVASFGLSLSRTLHDYGAAVVGAEKRLKGLDKDIAFTSRIISQLGCRLEDSQVQALVSEDTIRLTQDAVAECEAIFQAMEDVIAKIRSSGSMAKWTLYFRDSKIELLRSNLDRMKGNLNLLMGVIIHGTQMATQGPNEASISVHRVRIRELMIEKEHYTQRYLEEKRKYDDLLEKINSTSTLGSFIIMATGSTSQGILGSGQLPLKSTAIPAITTDVLGSRALGQPVVPSTQGIAAEQPPSQVTSTSATSPNAPTPSSTPPHLTSPLEVSADPCPPSPTSPPTRADGLRKRDRAVKTVKKVAKGAGIALSVAAAITLFPIAIPAYIVIMRPRRRQRSVMHSGSVADYLEQHIEGYTHGPSFAAPHFLGNHHMAQAPAFYQPALYQSSEIYAELPAVHELPGNSPELALMGRLLNTDIESRPDTRRR